MIVFEPVWVSSDEHLEKFYSIYKQASILERMFGNYNLPPNYPYVHINRIIFPSKKIPSVVVAKGVGKIDNGQFSFQSKPSNIFGSTTKNLLNLEFVLSANEMTRVSPAKAESQVRKYYNMPFIRVQTNNTIVNYEVETGSKAG